MDTKDLAGPRESTDVLARHRMIAEKYRIGRQIGAGGMGAVYEGVHTKLGARVAIKLMSASVSQNEKAMARFRREARAMAAVRHPNVVAVMDADTDEDGSPFLVMEYLEGESLSAVLARERILPPDITAGIAIQVLSGLSVAHEVGVVHRDLKPPNLFVCQEQDGNLRIKLLDFGISKFAADTSTDGLTIDGGLVGTPQYMSPEQAKGESDIDHRADLYGVGVLMYRMLTGKHPFRSKPTEGLYDEIIEMEPPPPRALVPEIPDALEAIVLRALAKDREDRFPDARAMRAAIIEAMPSVARDSLLPSGQAGITTSSRPPPPRLDLTNPELRAGSTRPATNVRSSNRPTGETDTRSTSVTEIMEAGGVGRRALTVLGVIAVVAGIVSLAFLTSGDDTEQPDPARDDDPVTLSGSTLHFGLSRYLPREEVEARHQPLADYLQTTLRRPVELVIVEDYENLARQVASGEVELAALSPYAYVQAHAQAPELHLLATPVASGGHSSYQGYVVARADLPIQSLEDFRGRSFCFVSPTSTSGYLYPRALFRGAGMNPDEDLRVRFTGDHISGLRAVIGGGCDGAAVYANAYHDIDEHGMNRDRFRLIASTEAIPYDAYVAAPTLSDEDAARVRAVLLTLEIESEAAQTVLASHSELEGFASVEDSAYDGVRRIELADEPNRDGQ